MIVFNVKIKDGLIKTSFHIKHINNRRTFKIHNIDVIKGLVDQAVKLSNPGCKQKNLNIVKSIL